MSAQTISVSDILGRPVLPDEAIDLVSLPVWQAMQILTKVLGMESYEASFYLAQSSGRVDSDEFPGEEEAKGPTPTHTRS